MKHPMINNVSVEAVQKATEKTWDEWLEILDKANAKKMTHKDIAQYLYDNHLKKGWWCQMVTVGYEQARGLRKAHERPDGFEANASKTIAVPLSELYKAWEDETLRKKWLKDTFTVTSSTKNKYLNVLWNDGNTKLTVGFYAKGDSKSMVALAHSKLAKESDVQKQKNYWKEALEKLTQLLSSS